MDPQWVLSFSSRILHIRAHLVLGSSPKRRKDSRPLGLGDRSIHGSPRNCPRKSGTDYEYLDEIYFPCYPWEHGHLVGIYRCLRNSRPQTRLFYRIRWCDPTTLHFSCLLPDGGGVARNLPPARLCVEVRETHVPAPNLPSRARDPEVQHPGLQAQNGAIPEGNQESTTSTADAKAKGLCFQSGGRESKPGAAGL